ncbi:glycosyltransferase [Niallia taxi]|uniref:glycosyltransferase n=1 Tax=Niallia taxi TaxID=2499688 RepID=UPI0030096EA1
MKLLLIWHAGGVESYWKRVEELAKRFDQVLLLVPEEWNEGGKIVKTNDFQLAENCNVESGKTIFNFHGATFFYLNNLYSVLKRFKPDIIHLHEEPWSMAAFQTILYTKLLKLKSKIILDSSAITLQKKPLPFSWIEKYTYSNIDLAFARNIEGKQILIDRGCTSSINILPNGVNTDIFKKLDEREIDEVKINNGIPSNKKIICYMGRIIKEKGIYDFIDAARIIINKYKSEYTFLIIGSGPEYSNLKDFINKEKLNEHFIVKEKLNPMEVPSIMNTIDLLVLPSRTMPNWKEQFGRVLVEAMACGIPVLGSSSGGIPEVINDERFVFREGNIDELSGKIRGITNNSSLRIENIKNGVNRVENLYSWEAISQYYYEVLKENQVISSSYIKVER